MGKKGGKKKKGHQGGSSKKSAPSNVPPAGSSASDVTETGKKIASESPRTGPDPPEVQDSENTATPSNEAQKLDEIHLITVPIKLQNGEKIELKLSPGDSVKEVRQHLHDASESCFFTCYDLLMCDKNDQPVLNFVYCNVADISTGEYHLEMVAVPYDDRSIMTHFNRTRDLLSRSSLARKHETRESISSNLEDHAKLVVTADIDNTSFLVDPPSNQDIQCVESIELSSFNPPTAVQRLLGDLVYLDVVTLKGSKFCITGTEKGFFVNRSIGKVLDPRPRKSVSETTTLVELVQKLSSEKRTKYERPTGVLVRFKGPAVAFVSFGHKYWAPSRRTLRYEGVTNIEIKESCNGLVCCYTVPPNLGNAYESFGRLLVYNPTTTQFRRIPLPNFKGFRKDYVEATTLVFDPQISPDYSILLVYLCDEEFRINRVGNFEVLFEMYCSSTGDWKRVLQRTVVQNVIFGLGVYWNGTIYWPSTKNGGLFFKVEERTIGTFPMPAAREYEENRDIHYFGECGDRLYVILLNGIFDGDKYEIYEMENNIWSMKYLVDLEAPWKDCLARPICISMEENEDSKDNSILRYNFREETTIMLCCYAKDLAGMSFGQISRPGVLYIDSHAAV